jgi:hypothetical protein
VVDRAHAAQGKLLARERHELGLHARPDLVAQLRRDAVQRVERERPGLGDVEHDVPPAATDDAVVDVERRAAQRALEERLVDDGAHDGAQQRPHLEQVRLSRDQRVDDLLDRQPADSRAAERLLRAIGEPLPLDQLRAGVERRCSGHEQHRAHDQQQGGERPANAHGPRIFAVQPASATSAAASSPRPETSSLR